MRLLDFGLAQLAEEETLTAAGDVPGTLAYMPPERLCTASPAGRRPTSGPSASCSGRPSPAGTRSGTARCSRRRSGSRPARRRSPRRGPTCRSRLTALIDRMLAVDPAARPPAAQLAARAARRVRRAVPAPQAAHDVAALDARDACAAARRSGRRGRLRRVDRRGAAVLPARCWRRSLALLAFGLTLVRPRLGLAFALAVPVLPLGNISSGLALVYGALACGLARALLASPREGLFLALGPLLAPDPGARLPAARLSGACAAARAERVQVGAAVLLAAVVAGLRHAPLPFTGAAPPRGLGIAGSEDPFAVAVRSGARCSPTPRCWSRRSRSRQPPSLLPLARGAGLWGIAGLGAGLIALTLLPAPTRGGRAARAGRVGHLHRPGARTPGVRVPAAGHNPRSADERPQEHRAQDRRPVRGRLRPRLPHARAAGRAGPQAGEGDGGSPRHLGVARIRAQRVLRLPRARPIASSSRATRSRSSASSRSTSPRTRAASATSCSRRPW